jgi:hypothetical protein
MPIEYLYKYKDVVYSPGLDPFDNPLPGYILKVELRQYKIIKKTPQGAWIEYYNKPWEKYTPTNDKFVLLTARKKFACATKEEALVSFRAKKMKQIKILSAQLEKAKKALRYANDMKIK